MYVRLSVSLCVSVSLSLRPSLPTPFSLPSRSSPTQTPPPIKTPPFLQSWAKLLNSYVSIYILLVKYLSVTLADNWNATHIV